MPARKGVPGAARVQRTSTLPVFLPDALRNTWLYVDVLSVPLLPEPLLAADVVQDTFEAGIAAPLGGTKLLSAFTLMRSTRPAGTLSDENDTVVAPGLPVVETPTFVTANPTAAGTVIFTESAADSTVDGSHRITTAIAHAAERPVLADRCVAPITESPSR